MQQSPVSRGGRRQAQCALCVMSCLLLLLGMLMAHLFPSLQPTSTPRHVLPVFDDHAQPYGKDEASVMGQSFGKGGCMWPGSGWITGLLLTPNQSLVLANWHLKALVVKSSFAERVIPLKVRPLGLTLLGDSSGRVAVTSGAREILLVSIDVLDPPLQTVATEKRYSSVTSGLTETTLIVSTVADAQGEVSIDVITLQGDVIRTLMDTTRFAGLRYCHFLTKAHREVLVSALDRNNQSTLVRLHNSAGSQWEAERCQDKRLHGHLWGTAAHETWGVFIGQDDGVVLRSPEGRYQHVLNRTDPYFNPIVLAVAQERLYVVWDHARVGDFVVVEYHLLRVYSSFQ